MPGYQHPCRYCDQFIPPDSNTCPWCGKVNPLMMRCPKCRTPIQKNWKSCNTCGIALQTACPCCSKTTFFDVYCDQCGQELKVSCPKCKTIQPPLGDTCLKCGKPLK